MDCHDDYETEGQKKLKKLKEDVKKLINERADDLYINVPRFLYGLARQYVKNDIEKDEKEYKSAYLYILEQEMKEIETF